MSTAKRVKAKDKIKAVKLYLSGKKSVISLAAKYGVEKSTVYWWIEQYKSEGEKAFTDSFRENRHYTTELKISAVKDYLNGLGSQSEICKKYNIRSKHQLRDWILMYNSSGTIKEKGGNYMKATRKTTFEERVSIVEYCTNNNNDYAATSKRFNVSYQQVRNWVKRFEDFGIMGLEDRRGQRKINQSPRNELEELEIRLKQLEHENHMLSIENKLLKKVNDLERRNVDTLK